MVSSICEFALMNLSVITRLLASVFLVSLLLRAPKSQEMSFPAEQRYWSQPIGSIILLNYSQIRLTIVQSIVRRPARDLESPRLLRAFQSGWKGLHWEELGALRAPNSYGYHLSQVRVRNHREGL